MKAKVHAIAGVVGFLTIATFWISTAITELIGSDTAISTVKSGIVWGMMVLIPAMVIAGGSGMSLGQRRKDKGVLAKKKRMPFIALNGLLILLPSAIFLASKANAGAFDGVFYAVQGLELIAGATNLTLMGLNIRDGLRLTARIGPPNTDRASGASIDLRKNGPAVVSGLADLTGADGASLATKPTMALCRCGASKNKPFCDGSHTSAGFTDERLPERSPDEVLKYEGLELTVLYNRLLCSKAYECGRRLGRVFDTTRDPWIDPDRATLEEVLQVVRVCPSGALSYQSNSESSQHEVEPGANINN